MAESSLSVLGVPSLNDLPLSPSLFWGHLRSREEERQRRKRAPLATVDILPPSLLPATWKHSMLEVGWLWTFRHGFKL